VLLGRRRHRSLVITHGIDDFADALVTLSLAGSLFFRVSLEASRTRILLYLLLTAVPLAAVAPLVGPLVERTRTGYRQLIVFSEVGRVVLALALARELRSLALYPLAFGILLCRKGYSIAKTAIVAQLVDDERDLVTANAHLSRAGTVAAALGTALGAVLLTVGAPWLLVVAAGVYLVAALMGRRIPAGGRRPAQDLLATDPSMAVVPEVRLATAAVAVTKIAIGALTFMLAFALKRGGEDQWVFGIGIAAGGIGGFAGTFVATRLRKWSLDEERLIVAALLVPGVVTAIGLLSANALATVVMALTIGAGASVASRAVESLFGRMVPDVARGRVVARSELQFQIAQILGSTFPVLAAPGTRPGFAFLALALLVGGGLYAWRARVSVRHEAGRVLLGDEAPAIHLSLPSALVRESERLMGLGAYRMAVAVADASVRVLAERAPPKGFDALWQPMTPLVHRVLRDDDLPLREEAAMVVAAARETVEAAEEHDAGSQADAERLALAAAILAIEREAAGGGPIEVPDASAPLDHVGDRADGDGAGDGSGAGQPPVVTDVVTGSGCPSTSQDSSASRTTNRSEA
jgi:predicted MFS family arabinose efflux permease